MVCFRKAKYEEIKKMKQEKEEKRRQRNEDLRLMRKKRKEDEQKQREAYEKRMQELKANFLDETSHLSGKLLFNHGCGLSFLFERFILITTSVLNYLCILIVHFAHFISQDYFHKIFILVQIDLLTG